MDNKTNIF